MNLTYLETLFKVVELNSFSKAADFLGYSQSNISYHIRKLEEYYQSVLLYKQSDAIILTKAGEEVYQFAELMIKENNVLKNKINEERYPLKIGTIESIASTILLSFMTEFRRQHPKQRIQAIVRDEQELLKLLKDNQLDIIIIFDELVTVDSTFRHYYAEETFQLVSKEKLAVSELTALDMVLTDRGCSYRKAFLDEYQSVFNIDVTLELDSPLDIKKVIEISGEKAFLPNYVANDELFAQFEKIYWQISKAFFIQCLYDPTQRNEVAKHLVETFIDQIEIEFIEK